MWDEYREWCMTRVNGGELWKGNAKFDKIPSLLVQYIDIHYIQSSLKALDYSQTKIMQEER